MRILFYPLLSVGFDGKGLIDLTPEKRNHEAKFSGDYNYFVDTYSTVNVPPVSVLRNAVDGTRLMTLEEADISRLEEKGWIAPEPFVAKGRDGKTDIWGNIYRPTTFDPTRSYPIIEYIYAGPQSSFVQRISMHMCRPLVVWPNWDLLSCKIDGMGTSNRSKAFMMFVTGT